MTLIGCDTTGLPWKKPEWKAILHHDAAPVRGQSALAGARKKQEKGPGSAPCHNSSLPFAPPAPPFVRAAHQGEAACILDSLDHHDACRRRRNRLHRLQHDQRSVFTTRRRPSPSDGRRAPREDHRRSLPLFHSRDARMLGKRAEDQRGPGIAESGCAASAKWTSKASTSRRSASTFLVQGRARPRRAADQDQNEKLTALCAAHPERFVGFASVALQFPDLAIEQIEYAIRKLGMRGVAVGASVAGQEFSEAKFHPFWQKPRNSASSSSSTRRARPSSPSASTATAGCRT